MSDPSSSEHFRRSEADIRERIRSHGAALVALSGGVDSGLVAALAAEALGPRSVAVTLSGAAVAAREVTRARAVAELLGIEHVGLEVDPLARREYRENLANRCYFCRSVEIARLKEFGAARAVRQYLDGVHADDLSDDRPGLRALDEAGFDHPLLWAEWGKPEVRSAARSKGLPNWDQPSDACLASRVAHGSRISTELLGRIETAESMILDRGFRRVRVRVRGAGARIEVDPSEVGRLRAEPLASEVTAALAALGFAFVVIDPGGYHGGGRPGETRP